jgi:hypothetical protein
MQRALTGESLDVPKYLLLAAAIPMHWIVLLTPMPHKPIAIVAILTIYHNLQYHRLIWFHNGKYKVRTGSGPGSPSGQPAWGGGSDRVTVDNDLQEVSPSVQERNSAINSELRAKYGAAELISRRLLYYIAFGILFGLLYQGPRQILGYISLKNADGIAGAQTFATQLGISFLWGYAFIHYYLDSKIWRVRRDPAVGKALNMG